MSNERIQILKMVQEGKVSPEEAAKLLEAVEAPSPVQSGPRATHLRIKVTEGSRVKNFSIGLGFVDWAVQLVPTLTLNAHGVTFDKSALQAAIKKGAVGKILEAEENGQRLEIWLDA